jgi:hypothetical protein
MFLTASWALVLRSTSGAVEQHAAELLLTWFKYQGMVSFDE